MNYEEFLLNLNESGWRVEGKSYAFTDIGENWQLAFIRMGGRFQRKGSVSFVICVRNHCNRNLDGEVSTSNKEPQSYPYKFTLEEARNHTFEYQCKLSNYELTYLENDAGWSEIKDILENVIPSWIDNHTPAKLLSEINNNGENGYIENFWIEDLQNTA